MVVHGWLSLTITCGLNFAFYVTTFEYYERFCSRDPPPPQEDGGESDFGPRGELKLSSLLGGERRMGGIWNSSPGGGGTKQEWCWFSKNYTLTVLFRDKNLV